MESRQDPKLKPSPLLSGARPEHECSQRVGSLFALPALIREVGVDPASMLAAVGLAPDALDSPDNVVSYPALGRLLGEVAHAADCPHFGLLAGRLFHLAHVGVVGELVRNAPTVRTALKGFMLHQHLNSGGGLVFLVERGAFVDFGYAIYHPGLTPLRPIYDCVLAYCLNTMRELCGPGFVPTQALLPYSRPANHRHYANLFGVHPTYDAEICALRFPARWLDRRVDGADPERRRVALQAAEHAAPADLRQRVYRALRLLLLHGRNSGDDVAEVLAMHRRTLNRRLHEMGTTFQQVLDDVRFEAARQLLCESSLPLDDIAAALGYAGVSPFMRTFKRWTGTTPDKWRRMALAQASHPAPERSYRHHGSAPVHDASDRPLVTLG
jgi:AraC-like DNA-binding protein